MNTKFAEQHTLAEDIAVIGMAGRFPGANDLDEFWRILREGKDVISHFSEDELKQADVAEALINNPRYVKARGILNDIASFDASFFGMTPYEAAITDPQHRLFLEICWESLEAAGYSSDKYKGLIGVFAGMSDSTYLESNLLKNDEFLETSNSYQTQIATSLHFLATKVAYHLNLKGPCVNISTACSTSLVAIIKACQSLQINECDLAIAGGIAIRVPQIKGYLYQEGGIFSSDGKCRAFDAAANGTVSSNAAGVVVLKRLSDAIKDGDKIEAIVKSFAINNDGATKAGYTAPSVLEQSRCIATALANLDQVESVSYIEAHGTGTPLGDPIEFAALKKAFEHFTQKKQFCALGSVKTNMGHSDTAAGVVGFIKTVLALKHKTIPASLHFKQPNPNIQLSDSPFFINQNSCEWRTAYPLRRAGVSSFGIGGTNAHIILEEAPDWQPSGNARPTQIISLSAKTPTALLELQKRLLNYLRQRDIKLNELADVAYTLHTGRREFAYRQCHIGANVQQVMASLQQSIGSFNEKLPKPTPKKPKVVFLLPGQGTLFSGCARSIYDTEPTFRRYIEQAAEYLEQNIKADILNYLLVPSASTHSHNTPAVIQQPALFILEYALANTLITWGIKPDALIGHSLGEYVAAHLAGVLSLQDAIHLVTIRGRLTDTLPLGAMLAIPLSADTVKKKITDETVSIAAINSPHACAISGSLAAIKRLEQYFNAELEYLNLKCALLDIPFAFHSSLVGPILPSYQGVLNNITLQPLKTPYISNVTGHWISNEALHNPAYFIEHFRKPVLFSEGVARLLSEGYNTFIEVGIGHMLTTLVRQHEFIENVAFITTLLSKKTLAADHTSLSQSLQSVLSESWINHLPVNWNMYYEGEKRQKAVLPTYPFERSHYWVEPEKRQKSLIKSHTPTIYHSYWETATPHNTVDLSCEKNWLIFVDDISFLNQIIQYLQKTILVIKGEGFKQETSSVYRINPEEKTDYDQLFNALHRMSCLPDYVLYGWSLDKNSNFSSPHLSNEIDTTEFFSLIYFTQSFFKDLQQRPLKIIIITNHLKAVLPDDFIIPDKAILIGLCLVIPQEYPQVTCHIVDTDIADTSSFNQYNYLPQLINEVNSNPKDNIIAYRRGIRLVNHYRAHETKPVSNQGFYLKKDGVYLITGGLGKIGLSLAEFLAEHYSANLILLARDKLSTVGTWDLSLSIEDERKQDSALLQRLAKIKKSAASLLLITGDVSNYSQMEELFEKIKTIYHKLDCIFHLAGIADETARILIKDLSKEQANRLFLPKIQGTKVIRRLIDKMPVNFCLLYSSLASIVGGARLAGYAASNCYLDSVVECYKNDSHTRWISISWDAWNFSDETLQPVLNYQALSEKLQAKEAMDLLVNCLAHFNYYNHFIISKKNLAEQLEKWLNPSGNLQPVSLTDTDLALKQNDNQLSIEDKLKRAFALCLGLTEIRENDNFYDLGGDSLSALRLLEMLENNFSIRIKLADFFKNNSIIKLAQLIKNQQLTHTETFVIKIKESGNGSPLFLIHPLGGYIFCYLELTKYLPIDNPCYAIQDPSIEAQQLHFKNLKEMASYYLEQIQTIQPTGPYFIGGFSLGASIAFEIGKQIIDSKMEIGGMFLIDGWAISSNHFKNPDKFHQAMQRTLNELNSYVPDLITNKRKLLDLAWHRMQLLTDYVPHKMDINPIALFKAETILPEYAEINDPTNHWQNYILNPIAVYSVPGDHATLLKAEGAKRIGKIISDYISSATSY